jgi:hypothetical protein
MRGLGMTAARWKACLKMLGFVALSGCAEDLPEGTEPATTPTSEATDRTLCRGIDEHTFLGRVIPAQSSRHLGSLVLGNRGGRPLRVSAAVDVTFAGTELGKLRLPLPGVVLGQEEQVVPIEVPPEVQGRSSAKLHLTVTGTLTGEEPGATSGAKFHTVGTYVDYSRGAVPVLYTEEELFGGVPEEGPARATLGERLGFVFASSGNDAEDAAIDGTTPDALALPTEGR